MEGFMARHWFAPITFAVGLAACSDDGGLPDINLFTIEDDIALGQQLDDEIMSDPATFPVLDEDAYADAYAHLHDIRDEILASGEVAHADDFAWELKIIQDDATLNAFAAPGGFMYVYTGLIRFLEVEDHLAGVIGHEIAHAAERHTTDQLTELYGFELLLQVVLGEEPGLIGDIAATLASLQFSKLDETDADEHSVTYLCETRYAANGAAGFFEKLLEAEGDGFQIPEFLSTHPSSESRVEDINALAEELGCSTEPWAGADYQALIDALPEATASAY
jgi:predicted Zn-dependent protease